MRKKGIKWPTLITDPMMSLVIVGLITLGTIAVTSTTVFIAQRQYHDLFYFARNHFIHLVIACTAFLGARRVPFRRWEKLRGIFLILSVLGLAAVLLPGLGVEVNGSRRWVKIAGWACQPSEFSKLFFLIYLSGYCAQAKNKSKRRKVIFWLLPILWLLVCACLLIVQPDFGSAAVLGLVTLVVLFTAGIPLTSFVIIAIAVTTLAVACAVLEPYRMLRIISFTDPWKYAYSSGYQLTQALMAIGRGGVWGVGLGNSLQKIFYLPEAHTDFIFAVFCEELGLIGGLGLLLAYLFCVLRMVSWAYFFEQNNHLFSALYTVALSSWIAVQVGISVGVNLGVLPTKGISLPFVSYGGTHLAVSFFAFGIFSRMMQDIKPVRVKRRYSRYGAKATGIYERF
ncbi:MAG: putative lipid II flippase FtsW [Pseudomonadota bacterium]|nr:putative lipid II flippase FtsW [Pseudomonadota bacterium]